MNVTAAQIEDIVRVVLKRLQSDVAAPPAHPIPPVPGSTAQPGSTAEPVKSNTAELQLTDRVITLETLKGRLEGTQAVVIHPKAVITPATRDELRTRNIRLVRQLPPTDSHHSHQAPLLLVTTHEQLTVLGKRVCSQQAQSLASIDETVSLTAIEKHLTRGGSGAVWCSESPFAVIAAMLGRSPLRAVQLPDQRDLPRALDQARPNVIVVDKQSWSEAAIANLIRNWYRSLR